MEKTGTTSTKLEEEIKNQKCFVDVLNYKREADYNEFMEAQRRFLETRARYEEAQMKLTALRLKLESISSV